MITPAGRHEADPEPAQHQDEADRHPAGDQLRLDLRGRHPRRTSGEAALIENGCIDYEVMKTIDRFEWHMRQGPGRAGLLHHLEVEGDALRYVGEILAAFGGECRPMRPALRPCPSR